MHSGFRRLLIGRMAPLTIAGLLATAAQAALTVSPLGPVDFGQVIAGQTVSKVLTLSNTGPGPAALKMVDGLIGPFSQINDCPPVIPAGSRCQLKLTFSPTSNDAALAKQLRSSVSVRSDVPVEGGVFDVLGTPAPATTSTTPTMPTNAPAFLLEPMSPLDFGSVRTGEVATRTLMLTNKGSLEGKITSVAGLNRPFSLKSECGATLAPRASCNIQVSYSPTSSDTLQAFGDLVVTAESPVVGSPYRVMGAPLPPSSGVSGPALDLSPPGPLDFGPVPIGGVVSKNLLLRNIGTADATISSIASLPPPFSLSNSCPTLLRPGTSCNLTVSFGPRTSDTVGTAASTSLSVTGSVSVSNSPYRISGVPGTPTNTPTTTATLSLSPLGPFNFGKILVGQIASRVLTLTNTGSGSATINGFLPLAPPYTFRNNCPGMLAPGASCTLVVDYTPKPNDPAESKADLVINASVAVAGSPYAFTASTGAAGTVGVDLAPLGPFNFGPVRVGDTRSSVLQLRNSGLTPATISSVSKPTAPFSVSRTTCGSSLQPGTRCEIEVTYSPTTADANTTESRSQLTIVANPPVAGSPYGLVGSPQTGNSSLAISPTGTIDFGSVAVGQSSSKTFTLSNTGTGAASLKPPMLPPPFTFTTDCTSTLAVGASCKINVTYTPTAAELNVGRPIQILLGVPSSAVITGLPLTLTGTASAGTGGLTLTPPGPFMFGRVRVGEIGNRVINLINNGGSTATLNGFAGISKPFDLKHNCPTSLAPGRACQLSVSFSPAASDLATANASAKLTIDADVTVIGSPYTFSSVPADAPMAFPVLALSPAGPFDFGTVDAGQVVTKVLTLTNTGTAPGQLNGFTGLSNPFTAQSNCPTFLRPSGQCQVQIRYAPTNADVSSGTTSGELTVAGSVKVTGSPFAVSGTPKDATAKTDPDAFTFEEAKGVALNTPTQSNIVTIKGITRATLVSILGGEYSINGLPYTSSPGAIRPGDTVRVRVTSSSDYNDAVTASLTIGTVSADFIATTLAQSFTVTGDGISANNLVVEPTGSGTTQSLNVEVTLADVLGAATVTAAANGRFAEEVGEYKVYVAGLVPAGALGLTTPTFYMKDITANWVGAGSPLAAYLENVLLYSQDSAVKLDVLSDFDFGTISGVEFYLGYGLTDTEMFSTGRYRAFYKVP